MRNLAPLASSARACAMPWPPPRVTSGSLAQAASHSVSTSHSTAMARCRAAPCLAGIAPTPLIPPLLQLGVDDVLHCHFDAVADGLLHRRLAESAQADRQRAARKHEANAIVGGSALDGGRVQHSAAGRIDDADIDADAGLLGREEDHGPALAVRLEFGDRAADQHLR